MKKIVFLLAGVAIMLFSCNPNEELYDTLDEEIEPYHDDIALALTEDDYEEIADLALETAETADDSSLIYGIEDYSSFSAERPAKDYVPAFLGNAYQALGKNSTAKVTYNYYTGGLSYLSQYGGADVYTLDEEDYQNIGGTPAEFGYFTKQSDVDLLLPNALKAGMDGAESGDLAIAKYQFSEDTDTSGIYLTMGEDEFGLILDTVKNHPVWGGYVDEEYGNSEYYFGASTYYANFDQRVDKWREFAPDALEGLTDEQVVDTIAARTQQAVQLMLELKYGDALQTGAMYFVTYDTYDGSGHTYTVNYLCTDAAAPSFDLMAGPVEGQLGAKPYRFALFEFDGRGWGKVPHVVALDEEDYLNLSINSSDNYFGGDLEAETLLPKFLGNNYPYAAPGDTLVVVYHDGSFGNKDITAQRYDFDGAAWTAFNPTEERTAQFLHNGEQWVFDPTVRFTVSSSDLMLIVDERDNEYIDSYGTAEYYSGASSYYENFDLRVGPRVEYDPEHFEGLSTEAALDLIWQRILEEALPLMLQKKFPQAQAEVSGIPVHYVFKFETYNNDYSRGYYEVDYVCTESATTDAPATFELHNGPVEIEEL